VADNESVPSVRTDISGAVSLVSLTHRAQNDHYDRLHFTGLRTYDCHGANAKVIPTFQLGVLVTPTQGYRKVRFENPEGRVIKISKKTGD
jgi:hypothetical protein